MDSDTFNSFSSAALAAESVGINFSKTLSKHLQMISSIHPSFLPAPSCPIKVWTFPHTLPLVSPLESNWRTSGPSLSHSTSRAPLISKHSTNVNRLGRALEQSPTLSMRWRKCKWKAMSWLLCEHVRYAGNVILSSWPWLLHLVTGLSLFSHNLCEKME